MLLKEILVKIVQSVSILFANYKFYSSSESPMKPSYRPAVITAMAPMGAVMRMTRTAMVRTLPPSATRSVSTASSTAFNSPFLTATLDINSLLYVILNGQ